MHDATECGVIGGLFEVAQASGTGIVVEKDRIPVPPAVLAICSHFGMDPLTSISEGTLIITVRPEKVQNLLAALKARGIAAEAIGHLVEEEKGFNIVEGGKQHSLAHPRVDPFWSAMKEAMEKGLT
jgi:hydrogenase maturation factor